jgi:hypothetical protein
VRVLCAFFVFGFFCVLLDVCVALAPALPNRIAATIDVDQAYRSIKRNIEFNGLDPARVVASNADAVALMFASRACVRACVRASF